MSRELLKTSLRHTHAYIDAYGADLLQDVEMLFRHTLEQAPGTAEDEMDEGDEQGDFSVNFDAPVKPAVAASSPVAPSMETAVPVREQDHASSDILVPVEHWHFRLPAIVAAVAVAAFLSRGWLS